MFSILTEFAFIFTPLDYHLVHLNCLFMQVPLTLVLPVTHMGLLKLRQWSKIQFQEAQSTSVCQQKHI